MANDHSYAFFGSTSALTFRSSSAEEPFVFLKCIKKKQDGSWEKPSKGEGKTIRFNLEELAMMLLVLKGGLESWEIVHKYKETNTKISFEWQQTKEQRTVWVKIGDCSKLLSTSQIEIFRLLIKHILKEKIAQATSSTKPNDKREIAEDIERTTVPDLEETITDLETNDQVDNLSQNHFEEQIAPEKSAVESEQKSPKGKNKETTAITGTIKGETEKALNITFASGKDIWVPKSVIHSELQINKNIKQLLEIEKWFLDKNKAS